MSGSNCSRCGAALPEGVPAEECPRCLLAAGLESMGPAAPGDAADAGAPRPAPTAPSPEEIGKHFPQLEVLELLGQGGMGIVYKARQRVLDRVVALKVMPPEAARDSGFADRFSREARTLARLQHPNIVSIFESGQSDGLYYLLMEFVDGANLRQAMRAGHLSPAQALAIVPQVCDALQYAHENGVVHRDVKPENILIDRASRVKIADFGLAKIVQRTPVDVTLTRAGQVMGTLHYMAPEQYRTPDAVDHRADIYSLGVVFYEMLTGELPLGSFPAPSEKAAVNVRLDRVVMRALESERDRRWQSASDVKTRMTEIAAGPDAAAPRAAAAPAVEVPPAAPVGRASRLATVGGLGVPAAMVLAAIVWGAFRLASDDQMTATSAGLFAFTGAVFAGWIASLVAWARIQHSKGALTGLSWAVVGTLVAPVFLCCTPFLAFPLGGISVKEGPDGTRVRMPFIDVEESKDGTRVRMPGIDVTQKDGRARVRMSGLAVSSQDREDAVHVTGGPESLTASDRASLVATVRALWKADGHHALFDSATVPLPIVNERSFRFFHLALDHHGEHGRLVMSNDEQCLSFPVQGGDGLWSFAAGEVQFQQRAATEADRDGSLENAEDRDNATHVTGGPASLSDSDRAALAATMHALWNAEGGSLVKGHATSDFRFFHLVLEPDGASGRLVMTDDRLTVAIDAKRDGDRWTLDRNSSEVHGGAATEADRDGRLDR